MSNNPETVRKRNRQNNETEEQRNARLARDRNRKRQKKANETEEEHNARLTNQRERRKQRKSTETTEERSNRLEREKEIKRNMRLRNKQIRQEYDEERQDSAEETDDEPVRIRSAKTISVEEHRMLQKFRETMDNIRYNTCPVCNERIPLMSLVKGSCRRCHTEKKVPKKFSAANNMDPGDIPDELKGLTEIEEMLIAQVFTVMTVYRLRGGQTGYRGNVINFPQDIQEFTNRLPRHPSSLDVLVIRRQSANDSTAFRDFIVRRAKVRNALMWLKANNRYYADIIIDQEILQSLPENDSIAKNLPQLQNDQLIDDIYLDEERGDDGIACSFVPSMERRVLDFKFPYVSRGR